MELPIVFENRMKDLLGEEYPAFYASLTEEREVKGLRVNPVKADAAALLAALPFEMESIPYVDGGFILPEGSAAGKHPYHHAGAYYMQDPGAMATVAALPEAFWQEKELRVLDFCAAPGGKTTQIAARIQPTGGAVVANEYVPSRSHILAGNVERMGLTNVCVTNLSPKHLAKCYPDFFDLVVVDAPCSGEGMFRKNNPALSEWSPSNVEACAARQEEILESARECVREGGYLLYSTCTYAPEENERTVLAFLRANPDYRLIPCASTVVERTADGIDLSNGEFDLSLCRRFYPHRCRGEGQFVALLQRTVEGNGQRKPLSKDSFLSPNRADRAVVDAFLKETIGQTLDGITMCGGNVCAFPAHETLGIALPPFGVVAAGVTLGELRQGRIVPHHHFFMAYGSRLASTLTLAPDDPAVSRYLAGEEISAPNVKNGYTALLLSLGDRALPLGGGKTVDGRLKNYYPKGLRVR